MSHRLIAYVSMLLLLVLSAASARAQKFSDWTAPVNLGSPVNTSALDG